MRNVLIFLIAGLWMIMLAYPLNVSPLETHDTQQSLSHRTNGDSDPPQSDNHYATVGIAINLILAVATLVIAVFAVIQANAAKGNAIAAKEGAEAAKVNAHVAIQTERPWLVVTAQHHDDPPKNFSFRVTNQGRTPARIIKQEIGVEFAPDPMKLPVPPVYHPDVIRLGLVVQDNWFKVLPIEPERFAMSRGMKEQVIDDARMFLCAYGRVVYEDLISRGTESAALRETRWCFVYLAKEKRFVQSGPEEYNSYT